MPARRRTEAAMASPDPQAQATQAPAWTWQGGWLQQARHLPSPNFGERPAQALIDLVVVHSISLPPGEYGTGAVQQLFTNQLDWDAHPYYQGIRGLEVSAHFFITRQGEVWQFVDCDARAWHAGASCWRGRDRCNDDSIGIELEDRKSTRLNSSHVLISYAVFCLKKKKKKEVSRCMFSGYSNSLSRRKYFQNIVRSSSTWHVWIRVASISPSFTMMYSAAVHAYY